MENILSFFRIDHGFLSSHYAWLGGVGVLSAVVCYRTLKSWQTKAPSVYDASAGRKLGYHESVFFTKCCRGNSLISNILIFAAKQEISTDNVQSAVYRLMERHPLLRMRVENRKGTFWFVPMDRLIPPVADSHETDAKDVLERELLTAFDTERCLWRIKHLPRAEVGESSPYHQHKCVLVITFHHCIVDGVGYMRMYNDLLSILTDQLTGSTTQMEKYPLMPPVDEFLPQISHEKWTTKLYNIVFAVLASFKPLRKRIIRNYVFQEEMNAYIKEFGSEKSRHPDIPVRTCIKPFSLSADFTASLFAQCKERKVTVQGALQSAGSFGWARLWHELKQDDPRGEVAVVTGLPMNIRNQFNDAIPPHHLGCYFMADNFEISVPAEPVSVEHFWQVASQIKADVRKSYASRRLLWFYHHIIKPCALAKVTADEIKQAESVTSSGRYHNVVLFSNKGNCSFLNRTPDAPVKILARYGACGEHYTGPLIGNDISSFEGKLFWTMAYFPHILPKEIAEKWLQYTLDLLERILKG